MRTRTIIVAAMVAALAGCTTSANGTPTPDTKPGETSDSTQSSSPPSPEDETYGAPRVSDPLDATRFLADPCATLTSAQQTNLGFSKPGEPDTDDPKGPSCLWLSDDSGVGVSFLILNKNGLSDLYRVRDSYFKFFEETTVAGYPAVHADVSDDRDRGFCGVTVGITDTLAFLTSEQGELDASGACARAKEAAAAVIATMKAGQ